MRKKLEDDENKARRVTFESADALTSSSSVERNEENSRFIQGQGQKIKKDIENQDIQLGMLGDAVDGLQKKAAVINTELKEQTVMLDELDASIENASDQMNTVQRALEKLLKTKDGCQIWTIVILALVLIVLGVVEFLLILRQSDLFALFPFFSRIDNMAAMIPKSIFPKI